MPARTLPRMRHASSGGDMVSPSVMQEMKRVFPNAELFVIYGCTEISCMGTTFPIPRETKVNRTFVGKPFPDVALRVLDSNRNLVPFGVVGEICFAGEGIVRGYFDRPELTAEKFVEIEGRRFYQTGDMGRLHPDYNLEILGRRDFQVQLRGIRIELAGLEKTVQELGLAAQCAVVAKKLEEGDVRLLAFVVKPSVDSAAAFRRTLAAELPDYMLPHHVVALDAMPLTVNGKLDRNRLKEMPWDSQLGSSSRTPPANERERKIADVFARVLGRAEVGVEDSFFDLGGDSLRCVIALQEIELAIGVAIAPHVLFEGATVRALANHAPGEAFAESRPIALSEKSSGPPLFMLSGIHIYRALANRLGARCSCYGVFARREMAAFGPESGSHSIEDLARDYLTIIRSQQPKGPYRLLGYSFAGIVAYELAQQLRAAGEEVSFLALVDAALPEWVLGWRYRVSQIARLLSAPRRDVLTFVLRRLKLVPPGADSLRYRDHERLGPLEERRDEANRAAAALYTPFIRPFAGRVTLIVSGARLREDPLKNPRCGWSGHVGSLDTHAVDVHHLRMLSDEPYVSEIAEVIAKGLRRSD
jgi:thioesterase domain-containing protein